MGEFDREPIFWASTRPGYNDKDRQRVRFEDGRRIVERVPQRGHQGDYENRRPARGVRSVRVVRHEGHVVDSVLTNGAAHLDPNTEFGQYIKAKWRHYGWFPLGACPLALVAAGELQPEQLRERGIVREPPCPPRSCSEANPCPHALAERAARQQAWALEQAELCARFRDPADKMIDAQREQTAVLAETIAAAVRAQQPAQQAPALAAPVVQPSVAQPSKEPKAK